MAVNTFLKICEVCSTYMMKLKGKPDQMSGNPGLHTQIWDLLQGISGRTSQLKLPHKIIFFEGIGHLLSKLKDE